MTYDYIIAGAGPAGCVLASRLSEDKDVRVLLLEAGGGDWNPLFHMPAGFAKMTKGVASWGWETVPQKHMKNRVVRVHAGHGDRRRLPDHASSIRAGNAAATISGAARTASGGLPLRPALFRRARTTSVSPTTTIPMGAARRLDAARRPADLRRPISGPGRNSASPTITTSTAGGRQASVSTS